MSLLTRDTNFLLDILRCYDLITPNARELFMPFIIAIANNKGGVGKTTCAVNLADALGKRDKNVLVVDADSQSNATGKLIRRGSPIRKSLYDILSGDLLTPVDALMDTTVKRVMLLPNISDSAGLEPKLISKAPNSLFLLRNILREYALKNHDYTIIDCPPNMGLFVLMVLQVSDFVIVPVRAGSMDSVEGLTNALNVINEVRTSHTNPDLRFLRLMINALDRRTGIGIKIQDHLRERFGKDEIFNTTIPISTVCERAEAMRSTIFQLDATCTAARAYRDLAAEIVKILEGETNGSKKAKQNS